MSLEPEKERTGIFPVKKNSKPSLSSQSASVNLNDKTKVKVVLNVNEQRSDSKERQTKNRVERIPDSTKSKKKENAERMAANESSLNDLGSPWTNMDVRIYF